MTTPASVTTPSRGKLWKRAYLSHPILFTSATGLVFLFLLHAEENWRGKRIWLNCARQLQAKGAVLDWKPLCARPVPPEQNFFEAPKISDWFCGSTSNDLTSKLSLSGLAAFAQPRDAEPIVVVRLVSPESEIAAGEADAVLRYETGSVSVSSFQGAKADVDSPASDIIPLIVLDEVPLADAIRHLARQAQVNYVIDPDLGLSAGAPQPSVSVRWENVTAWQALSLLLNNYGLQWVRSPSNAVAKIVPKNSQHPKLQVEQAARKEIEKLIGAALAKEGISIPIRGLIGSQELLLLEHPLKPVNAVRLIIRTSEPLTDEEVAQVFPAKEMIPSSARHPFLRVESVSDDWLHVFLVRDPCFTASGYLQGSGRCEPEFAVIRAALERPYCVRTGEWADPAQERIQNFVVVRMLAQTLAQRAQCYLLLSQPQDALRELNLLHDLNRVVSSKPHSLVSAMIQVAVAGVYTRVVADGLRLGAWQEPQLKAIEQQLGQTELMPVFTEAFQRERLWLLSKFEQGKIAEVLRLKDEFTNQTNILKSLTHRLLPLVPRGWIYQNMATFASLEQNFLEAADNRRGVIFPRQIDAAEHLAEEINHRSTPGTFLESAVFPSFIRAWQVMAKNQSSVQQALVACALERYRLARQNYPATLQKLVPDFLEAIPRDVINGEPLVYRLTNDQGYLLYSVAWNGVDDGGRAGDGVATAVDTLHLDWSWNALAQQ